MRKLYASTFSFLFFISAGLSGLQAQSSFDPGRGPHFSMDAHALYDGATKLSVATTGGGAIVLEDDESYTFDAEGRATHVEYVVYKVLNQKGVDGWDGIGVEWAPWHEARPEIKVRVIGNDYSEHWLDPKQITEAPSRSGEYKMYSDDKTLRAPFPAIAPGVVVEEEFVTRETSPFFSEGHVGWVLIGREQATVLHSLAVFDAPLTLPLKTQTVLLPELKAQRTESDGRVKIVYDQGPMDGIDPAEPNLPSDVPHYPAIEFSTGASWQRLATEYSRIVDQTIDMHAVKPLAEEITAGKKSREEKMAALLGYLGRDVRYTGIEFGEAALVPHAPAEVLAHKYGDCKDKATLLVALLRASGIEAYVALLNVGSRQNVPEDLPGMGLFDHAIVYVPGSPALWFDATDPYARVGQLPAGDRGRLALVAAPSSTRLIRTPESGSRENVLYEERTLRLAENGPASVTEVSRPTGVFEGEFRDFYADRPDKEMREGLQNYVKGQYVAEKLTTVDRSDPLDLNHQFELTLSCEKAKRGFTDLDSSEAAIRLEALFQRLPDELKRRDDAEKKKADADEKPKKPRTADWQLTQAFSTEWRYRIVPPLGFIPKPLPKNERIALGPALLTEEFSAEKDGTVVAHIVFDSGKRRYSAAEATEVRNKVAEIAEGPAILINFEPRGEALLREGKVGEALASYRALVAAHPTEAVHHLQVAKVLLEASMGEAARAEARKAVALEPSSAMAEKTLAQILKHDLVGRALRPGSDMKGAAEAYRAAIALDPDDSSTQGDLALLLEYDKVGRRYGSTAPMAEAIGAYQKLGPEKLAELGLTNNLAYALFYGGRFAEAEKAALALSSEPKALIAACEAMLHGSKAGLAEANKRSTSDDGFKSTARTAGEMLMNLRHYEEAASFLEAGASGDDAARTVGLARMLRAAEHHERVQFANTPADLARQVFALFMDTDLTIEKMKSVSSRNAIAIIDKSDPEDLKKALDAGREMNSRLARQEASYDVTLDILLSGFDPKVEGNDETGYRVRVQIPGGPQNTFFVVKEQGKYKLLDSLDKPNALALEILDDIAAGKLEAAKTMLDWLREDSHLGGGDDPFGGPVFPRFWTRGQAADARRMKLAAASLLAGTKPTAPQAIQLLDEAQKTAVGDRERSNIRLALQMAYSITDNYAKLLEVSSQLLDDEPSSKRAFGVKAEALMGLGRFDEAMALTDARLKLLEGDEDALSMKMQIELERGHYAAAREWAARLIAQGKGTAGLLNDISWYSLFDGKVSSEQIDNAIKATQMERNNAHILHTLACLYEEAGKVKEARDLLLRSMDELGLDEPNDDYWYALGRIAELYGERDTARADYLKLKAPTEALQLPSSSYLLAQNRLKAMGGK